MENWEKFKIAANALSILAIPIVLALIGYFHSNSIKNRELEGRFVELAVDILRSEATPESENFRKWAVHVIDNYSGIELNEQAKVDLVTTLSIPNPYEPAITENMECSELLSKGIGFYNSSSYAKALQHFENAKPLCKNKRRIESYIARTKQKLGK